MLIALFAMLLLGQGSGVSALIEELGCMEKAIQQTVQDEAVRAEALELVREIRDRVEVYNRQRAETITAFLESENPLAKPSDPVKEQLDEFERATRKGQVEIIRIFLELRSLLTREQWEAVTPPMESE